MLRSFCAKLEIPPDDLRHGHSKKSASRKCAANARTLIENDDVIGRERRVRGIVSVSTTIGP